MLLSLPGALVTLVIAGDASRASSQDLPMHSSTRQPAELSCHYSRTCWGISSASKWGALGNFPHHWQMIKLLRRCSGVPSTVLPGANKPLPAAPQHYLEDHRSWLSPAGGLDKVSLLGRAIALNNKDMGCPPLGHARTKPCNVLALSQPVLGVSPVITL